MFRKLFTDQALVSYGRSGIVLFDISDPQAPTKTAELRFTNKTIVASVLLETTALVAYSKNEVGVVDLSDPAMPMLLSPYTFPTSNSSVVDILRWNTGKALIPVSRDGLYIVSFANPSNPVETGHWTPPAGATIHRVAGNGKIATVSGLFNGLSTVWMVDFSTEALPVELGSFQPGFQIFDLQVSGDRAYLALGNDGLRIWDVSNPAAAMEIGSYSPPGLPIVVTGIAVQGGIVLAAAGDAAGVIVLGVIDASSIQELSFILTPGEALKISRDLNHVVLADGSGGVRFWGQDLSGQLFSDGFESGDTGAWQ